MKISKEEKTNPPNNNQKTDQAKFACFTSHLRDPIETVVKSLKYI